MEPCQSGLTYLFAKEAGALNPLDGSNPSGSANALLKKIAPDMRVQTEALGYVIFISAWIMPSMQPSVLQE